jgi:hypothetical protein
VVSVRPDPPPEVLAAIVAAVGQLLLCPGPPDDLPPRDETKWRFSGRSWAKPTLLRRERP